VLAKGGVHTGRRPTPGRFKNVVDEGTLTSRRGDRRTNRVGRGVLGPHVRTTLFEGKDGKLGRVGMQKRNVSGYDHVQRKPACC